MININPVRSHRRFASNAEVSSRILSPQTEQNPTKVLLSNAIRDYTAGRANQGDFRLALAGKVPIDGKLERLLR